MEFLYQNTSTTKFIIKTKVNKNIFEKINNQIAIEKFNFPLDIFQVL